MPEPVVCYGLNDQDFDYGSLEDLMEQMDDWPEEGGTYWTALFAPCGGGGEDGEGMAYVQGSLRECAFTQEDVDSHREERGR